MIRRALLCLCLLLPAGPVGAAQDWPILHHEIQASVNPDGHRLEVVDRILSLIHI